MQKQQQRTADAEQQVGAPNLQLFLACIITSVVTEPAAGEEVRAD